MSYTRTKIAKEFINNLLLINKPWCIQPSFSLKPSMSLNYIAHALALFEFEQKQEYLYLIVTVNSKTNFVIPDQSPRP